VMTTAANLGRCCAARMWLHVQAELIAPSRRTTLHHTGMCNKRCIHHHCRTHRRRDFGAHSASDCARSMLRAGRRLSSAAN
jgi:hypothetical protein